MTTNATELALLNACLCTPQDFPAAWARWRADADIDNLSDGSNRLLPLLYKQAQRAELQDREVGRLRGLYRYHWCRNQLLLAELQTVLKTLHAAGVQVMVLKGLALIQHYYRDPGLRPMSDMDLMVRLDDFMQAERVLTELGYAARTPVDTAALQAQRFTHAIDFRRDSQGQTWEVDLHWTPLHRATWPGAEQRFWAHAQPTQIKGVACWTLDATHQLLHTCLHGAVWNAVSPIRWIPDAMFILRQAEIDWPRLLADARSLKGLLLLQRALNTLKHDFAAPIPEVVMVKVNGVTPSRFERLELKLQTESADSLRVDEVLLLAWFNHARAFDQVPLWKVAARFPAYLKHESKLESWWALPALFKRRAARLAQRAATPPTQGQ